MEELQNTVRSRFFRIPFLILVFIGGILLFSRFMNYQQVESASDLEDPTLPVMYADIDGNKINRMYGFTMEMDSSDMRESLIPITTERSITISYKANDNEIKSVSYEITSPDTGEVIENSKIGNFKTEDSLKTASFTLSEPILMNREYPIRFTIATEDREIYYYSRIIQRSDIVTERYVQFVYDFYENCTNAQGSSDINAYLETDATITNNSYTSVNIKSQLSQVTWGSLKPQIYRKAVPMIKEINENTCSITNDYLISAENTNGETEIYHVHEFYRLRYYNGQMMLLNFNRKALQVFDASLKGSVSASGINLGIAERDVEFETSESGTVVAFIQDRELWEYGQASEKLSRIFSFHSTEEGTDDRDDNINYGIHLIRVTESGDVDFTVYGYMSAGEHEGKMGVSLCHYNAETSVVTERAFVEYQRSYDYLKEDLNKLSYYSEDNNAFFLYLDRTVYKIGLETGSVEKTLENIHPDCFTSSSEQSKIAYMEEMKPYASTSITLVDLDSGESREISAGEGEYVKALGFLNEDFLYGTAQKSDLRQLPAGELIFAMADLTIEDFEGNVIKEYHQDGYYVTNVTMEEGLADLERMTLDAAGNYVTASNDNIMNNRQQSGSEVTVKLSSSSRQGTTVTLRMPNGISNLKPLVTDFQIRYASEVDTVTLSIPKDDTFDLYYVYAYGELQEVLTNAAEAVLYADENVGVVINQEGQYIYERGNKDTKHELYNEDIPAPFLTGEINSNTLQEQLGDDAIVMNLTGCTLDQVLYQVSQGRAVVTKLADGSVTVIVGYDRYNTLLYNFDTGEHYYMGINDSTNSMLAAGNVFVSYVEPQATVKKNAAS